MMILPNKSDAIHKAWLYRVLGEIADSGYLSDVLYFKGGTCASMLGWLDRFSVDLDFDLLDGTRADHVRTRLEEIIKGYGTIREAHKKKNTIFFMVAYDETSKNIKVEINKRKLNHLAEITWISNEYELGDFGMGGAYIKQG